MKKLRENRGETLVEVLASILIASLSVALLFGCVMASANMDRDARKLDAEHYKYLSEAEEQREPVKEGAGEVKITVSVTNEAVTDLTVKTKELPVRIYGGARMYSYKRADS